MSNVIYSVVDYWGLMGWWLTLELGSAFWCESLLIDWWAKLRRGSWLKGLLVIGWLKMTLRLAEAVLVLGMILWSHEARLMLKVLILERTNVWVMTEIISKEIFHASIPKSKMEIVVKTA